MNNLEKQVPDSQSFLKYLLLTSFVLALKIFFLMKIFTSLAYAQNNFVPDVRDQFSKLSLRPEALGFWIGNSPDPTLCKHYQGLARLEKSGTPYVFISRSGNINGTACPFAGNNPGNLIVVKMGSRNTSGERMRSNRLFNDLNINYTPPDPRDVVVSTITFNGQNGWPRYGHPGGMQIVGDILAVPLEASYNGGGLDNLVLFIDVSNPENPTLSSQFALRQTDKFSAGLVAITPVLSRNNLRYLMLITGMSNEEVRIYRSLPTGGGDSTDLSAPDLAWEHLLTQSENQINACLNRGRWPTGFLQTHQMLNFVREGDLRSKLYLIGARNSFKNLGRDSLDLYSFNIDRRGNPDRCFLSHVDDKHLTSKPIMGGGDSANFLAASGVYVSPSGELIIYGTSHDNDGPGGTVRFAEWRHREVVRKQSPTLRPTISYTTPLVVDEGSSATFSAEGKAPITKAWLQLFEDDDAGSSLPGTFDSDEWLMIDYEDWSKDNFRDFKKLNFNDEAGSWRWFAPVGCTIRANDDDFGDSNFPGRFTKTLIGTGTVQEEPNLDNVPNDDGDFSMNDELTSAEFFANCDDYYSAAIRIFWDLDYDGTFEYEGVNPTFFANNLDGPSLVPIRTKGQHPSDPSGNAIGLPNDTYIEVRNVPPSIDSFYLENELGQRLGVDVNYAIERLATFVNGTFTDPGKPDTHTALIDWSDGTQIRETSFDVFSDSRGGVVGTSVARHSYNTEGGYYAHFEVTDDDGGRTFIAEDLVVFTAIDALKSVVADLLEILLNMNVNLPILNVDAYRAVYEAILLLDSKQLVGVSGDSAVDSLINNQINSAFLKMKSALIELEEAEIAMLGLLDLSREKILLNLIMKSVVLTEIESARLSIGPLMNPLGNFYINRAIRRVERADRFLAMGDYVAAMEEYCRAFRSLNIPQLPGSIGHSFN